MSQRWIRTLSWISICVATVLLVTTLLPDYANAYVANKAEKERLNSKQEIVELRTENSKTYLKGDGKTYITEQYMEPIHYSDKGKWFDIDNKVEAVSGAKALDAELPYMNKDNKFRVSFAKYSKSNKLVRFQLGQAKADLSLIDAQQTPIQVEQNRVTYPNVYQDTDLVYHVTGSGLKEEWILHKYNGKSTFTMGLKVKNAEAVLQKDGSIQFVDAKKKVLFTVPAPFMVDANDSISNDVKLQIETQGQETLLHLQADEQWLQDPNRAYPVSIDPSFTVEGATVTYDAFVSKLYPTEKYGTKPFLITGNIPDYGVTESFIKFQLQPLLSGAQINSAKLHLYQYKTDVNQQVNLYPVTSSWDSLNVTWNTKPTMGSLLSSTNVGAPGSYSWDLTSLAQGWYNGTVKNYGVALRHQIETNDRKSFYSSDNPTNKPKLVITYTISPLGQEPFWTSAVTNVNTFNGNFYLPEADVEISGRGIPLSLVRSYNSHSITSGLFGYGWTSSIEQHLYDSGDGPIQYRDGDGTLHSFTPNGDRTYSTSQVLQLELKKNSDGTYTLTDASQTQYMFTTTGYLWKIIDTNGNTTTIAYSGAYPATYTDASGRKITFTRDANNRITKVTDPANRTIEYTYNTAGDLTTVTKKDADGQVLQTVTYEYDANHNLIGLTDPNGHRKTIAYKADDKVDSISYPITVSGQVQTATVQFAYDPINRLTTVTDPKGTKTLYTHNDYGNVTQVTEDPTGLNYKQTFAYNNENQLESQKDANTNAKNGTETYNYTYDENGNLTSTTNPLGETTTTQYDDQNNPIKETDAKGNTTTNEYDNNNNPSSTTDSADKSSATKHDAYGNVTEETNLMSPGNNLVINGSFEIDRDNNGEPDDWFKAGGDHSKITWDAPGLTVDGVTLGDRSAKITNPDTTTAVYSKRVPYNPNKTYVLSGYAKTLNANGSAMIYAFGWNGQTYKAIRSASITQNNDPTRLQIVINPGDFPAGTNEIEIRGYVASSKGQTGEYWFDGLQIEEDHYGAYNVLENGDLERDIDPKDNIPDRWLAAGTVEVSAGIDGLDSTEVHSGNYSFRLKGDPAKWKTLRQDVRLRGGAGTVLTVSGFSKVVNPDPAGGIYGYIIETYSGTTRQETFTFNFDKSKSHDWQHRTAEIKPTKAFDNIKVFYEYSLQKGTAWFDTAKVVIGPITTRHAYDANGNYQTKTTDPVGRITESTYDTVGNVTSEKIGAHTTGFAYDALDRLQQVTDANAGITKYEYDTNGNKTKVINAKDKVTQYEYNEINQIKKITDAKNQSTSFEYDINGNQTKVLYPNGNTVESGFNKVNRQTSISHNGTERYTFEYDPNGNITKETDQAHNQATTYAYDDDNKVKSVQGYGSKADYLYDKNGNVTERKHTVGSTIITHGYGYDSLDQLIKITENGDLRASFAYDETDQVAGRKTGDQTSTVNQYNGAGDLVAQIITDKSGTLVEKFNYTYDAKGNITSIVSKAGTTQYVYDALDQLLKEIRPDGTIYEYTYDAVGNRLTKKVTQGGTSTTTNYTYDDADQLTAVNGTNYSYDANGNLISDGQRTFTYDAENRLLSVKEGNTTLAFYTYRADGMRKTMTTSSGTITFHYDEDNNVTHETNESGQVVASYTFDGIQPVSMTRGGQTYYYQLNYRGDVVRLTDANGATAATYEYDAYGNLISETGSVENPYRYAGYRYDQGTGLYYLQSRYYNPEIGRFLTRDTFDGFDKRPLSQNRYIYVENKTVKNIDPTGHWLWAVGYAAIETIDFLWGELARNKYNWNKFKKNVRYGQAIFIFVISFILAAYGGPFLRFMKANHVKTLNRVIYAVWHAVKTTILVSAAKGSLDLGLFKKHLGRSAKVIGGYTNALFEKFDRKTFWW